MPRQFQYSRPEIPSGGGNVMQTMGGMLNLVGAIEGMQGRQAQRARYEAETQQQQQALADQQRQRDLIQSSMQGSGGDPYRAMSALERAGHYGVAGALRGRVQESLQGQLETEKAKYEIAQNRFGHATQMMQGLVDADDDAISQQWGDVRRGIAETFGDGLVPYASHFPDADASPDQVREFLDTAYPMGLTASEAATRRKEVVGQLSEGLSRAKDQLEIDNTIKKAVVGYLPTVDTPEEMAQLGPMLRGMGASDALLQQISAVEHVDQIPEVLGIERDAPKAGTMEWEMDQGAKELGLPGPHALTPRQRDMIRRRVAMATRTQGEEGGREHKNLTNALKWARSQEARFDSQGPLGDMLISEGDREGRRVQIWNDALFMAGVGPGTPVHAQVASVLEENGIEVTPQNVMQFIRQNEDKLGIR